MVARTSKSVTEVVAVDADVRIKLIPKRGGRRVRVVVEYDPEIVESAQVIEQRIDPRGVHKA